MLLLNEVGEAHDGVQWRTDLVAHVAQEGVLHRLHLLCLLRLAGQLLLGGLQVADVTAHTEVFGDVAVGIEHRHEREVQAQVLVSLDTQRGLHGRLDGLPSEVVHVVQNALGGLLRRLVGERQQSCLRQTLLDASYLAVDEQRVRVGRIVGNAYTPVLHHVVDVTDVVLQLVRGLLQLSDVLLQTGVRLGHLGDVAPRPVDAEQLSVVIADGYQLQLIIELVAV